MSHAAPPTPRQDVAAVAAACALIAAAIEVGVAAFKQLVLHRIIFLSYDFPWMIPASYLLFVVPLTLLVHGLLTAFRRAMPLHTILGLLTTVLAFVLLIPYGVIGWWASGALVAGAGWQVARRARSTRPEQWLPALRRTAAVLAAIMAMAGMTIRVQRAWAARAAASTLQTPIAGDPNVLLIVLDTVRAANMGLYGYERPTTPELQKWASQSAVFDGAIATAPWTLPSHGSLFTGLAAGSLRVDWRIALPETPRTLAEVLRDRGYATGGFIANTSYTSYESGLGRGFVRYDDYRVSLPLVLAHSVPGRINIVNRLPEVHSVSTAWRAFLKSHLHADRISVYRPADQVADAFLDWQQTVTDRPFFAFLNLFDAHRPYRAPEAFSGSFSHDRSSVRDRYDVAIAWLDHVVGTTLESLRQRGVLDRTIVIVTSDHGEQFGEHGLTGHGNSLYLPVLRVPLLVRYPAAVPPGVRVGTVVSLRDVAATVLDLAGVSGGQGIPGISLASTWRRPAQAVHGDVIAELSRGINEEERARNFRSNLVARLDGRFHYIRDGSGREELYDFVADPGELKNLASSPAAQADLVRLRAGLPGR